MIYPTTKSNELESRTTKSEFFWVYFGVFLTLGLRDRKRDPKTLIINFIKTPIRSAATPPLFAQTQHMPAGAHATLRWKNVSAAIPRRNDYVDHFEEDGLEDGLEDQRSGRTSGAQVHIPQAHPSTR